MPAANAPSAAPNDDSPQQHSATSQSPSRRQRSTPSATAAPNPSVHQRTYQACIPCRKRKVRCDLGSVDSPSDPPCSRCRREAKECFFSSTRRKRRGAAGENADPEAGDEALYEIRGRKKLRMSLPSNQDDAIVDYSEELPRTPGGSIGRTQPLRRPPAPKPAQYGEVDEHASEQTTAILQHAEVLGGHDALKVLYQAAVHGRADSTGSSVGRPPMSGLTSASLPAATSPVVGKAGVASYNNTPMTIFANDPAWKTQVDQPESKNGLFADVSVDSVAYAAALKAWSRFKSVRSGWFTAKEGIDYITYFYQHLSPLTPVALPDFTNPATHKTMLEQEPMLAVTMLLIASRHMKLEGPGSNSRPYAIHNSLWKYLSGMIDRVVWGQEQFGGGFCGAGAQPGCDVNPLTRKGLRTLGSVESLVLLTEWHPRAMHFPPDEDDDDLMTPDQPIGTPDLTGESIPKGIGGHRMDAWLEPCWRSDRMCWMLLGMAMSLAMEIGVFDSSEWQRHARPADGETLSAAELSAYDKRRGSVRNLLLVYVTQTSGRLGLTSMLPGYYSKPEDSDLFLRQMGQQDSVQEITFHFWLRIAALMREGNRKIFANKAFTRDLIRNGDYKAALEQLQRPLRQWRKDFDDCVVIPKHMRSIMEIEYEYSRVYLNALGLQAVAERCANDQPTPVQPLDPPLEMARSATTNGVQPISPTTLSKWLGGDRNYMQTVADAARNLLKVVVYDLYPDGFLRHAPVRTYFRIISVAIMLLKTFALGATESDVSDSLKLMESTVEALRTCIVDDVHVASRFADLLDTLATSLKPRLVRISTDGRHGRSRRVSHYDPSGLSAASPSRLHPQHTQATGGIVAAHQQQWNYHTHNNHGNGNSMLQPAANMTESDPMYGVSHDAYDFMGGNAAFSVMPPPDFSNNSPNSVTTLTGANHNNSNGSGNYDSYGADNSQFGDGMPQDWLALPLDPLISMSGADVHQTMYGPDIGGQDMLELLLNGNSGSTAGNSTNGYQ